MKFHRLSPAAIALSSASSDDTWIEADSPEPRMVTGLDEADIASMTVPLKP
jgi:hypothetical protein